MNITGGQTSSYRFFTQSGFSMNVSTNSMDEFTFKLFGPSLTGSFNFQSGKCYDASGRFYNSYTSGAPFSFRVAYETGKYSTWVNDDLCAANQNLGATGLSDYNLTGFSFSGTRNMTMGVSLYGRQPDLYFSELTSTDGLNYTGFVRISGGYSGYLYSVVPENGNGTVITSNPFSSGNYYISGSNLSSGSVINTTFYFDFGAYNADLSLNVPYSVIPSGYTLIASQNSQTGLDGSSNYVQYQDFTLTTVWPEQMSYETYLKFLYRSGYTTIYSTGVGTGYYSGYISGSGGLSSDSISGYVDTGYYRQLLSNVGTGFASTLMTGDSEKFYYATGQVLYNYFIPAYSYEQTIDFQWDYCTGYIEGTLTGQVLIGDSGKFVFSNTISGNPAFYNGQYFTGGRVGGLPAVNFGYYEVTNNPSSEYLNTDQLYTGVVSYTGYAAGNMRFHGTGNFTGQFSGLIYSTDTGLLNGYNYHTGESYLQTGNYQYVIDNYYDYASHGFRTGGYLKKSSYDTISGGVYILGSRLTCDRNIPIGVADYLELYVKARGSLATGESSITLEGYSL